MNEQFFKKCPKCNETWSTQNEFISDRLLELIGYQANFEKLEKGLFYFTHSKENCKTTMVIDVDHFMNLYKETIFPERKAGSEECSRYCLDQAQLDRCESLCECSFAREIMQRIKYKKGI